MKNKFLQTSKGILTRSFDPSKCKTALRLAGSRMKLLRNKKEVQVKQMKREIAQLLESGQDQTARIRVEHVIREEKMMAAYDLLEIYCELIVARLPIIESQKNCPIDLKEAIASLVFASPRCGDVPELLDVRKHFSAKYGKDFITATIELRPQCGVGRLLVEKLSATAPDGQTKVKVLSAIADEHNVKWDPMSFGGKDSTPPSDLLCEPSSKESELYAEATHLEAADVHASPINNKMHSSPLEFSQHDAKPSVGAEKLTSAGTSGVVSTFKPEPEPPAVSDERTQLFQGESSTSPHSWTMEFKDAASAAQVAAEAAERASMAARTAAEMASHGRIVTQYSTESSKSDVHILKDEGPEMHSNSIFPGKEFPESSVTKSSSEHPELQNEQVDAIRLNDLKTASRFQDGGSEEYSQAPSKSKPSADDDSSYHGVQVVDEHSWSNSLNEGYESELCMEKQCFRIEAETANVWPEKVENLEEERIEEQPGVSRTSSHSTISENVNVFSNFECHKFENDFGEDPSVGTNKSVIHEKAPQKSFNGSAAVIFDNSDSDFDDHESDKLYEEAHQKSSSGSAAVIFDNSNSNNDDHESDKGPTYDEQNLEFHLPSLSQNSPELLSINIDPGSPRSSSSRIVESTSTVFFTREESSPDVLENITPKDELELDGFAPVTFDDSDGATSEIDEDMNIGHNKVEDYSDQHEQTKIGQSVRSEYKGRVGQSVGSPLKNEEYSVFDDKQLSFSSDDELSSSEKMYWKKDQVDIHNPDSRQKFSLLEPSAKQPTLGSNESPMELKGDGNESSHEIGGRLNFGKLTGGLRHKAHNHLPFMKNRLDASSSVLEEDETTSPPPVERPETRTVLHRNKISKTPDLLSDSDSDSSEEEEIPQKSSGRQALTSVKIVKRPEIVTVLENNKISKTPDLHSDSDSDGSEKEESPQKNSGRRQALSVVRIAKPKPTLGASDSIFGSDNSDMDDDSARTSLTRKSHPRPGISRRTKVAPSSSGTSSYTKTHLRPNTLDSDEAMDRKSTTSYNSETPEKYKSKSKRRNSGKSEDHEQPISEGASSMPAKSSFWGPPEQYDSKKATSLMKQESEISIRSEAHDSDVSLGSKPSKSNSSHLGKFEQPTPAKVASKPTNSSLVGIPEKTSLGKPTSTEVQKSKVSQESASVEEPSSPQKKSEASIDSGNIKTATSNDTSSNKNDGTPKASHVHPKLPDYDTLFQSLRANRS